MAFSKPSPHRCTILKLSRLLSREDVNEILFLSEDFIPRSEVRQISSGIDLMRSLEQHGRLSPGKYNYLLACLKEVGRHDLVISLTEFVYSNLLESLPPGFRGPSQMFTIRIRILKNKQRRYVESMQGVEIASSNVHFWEEWCNNAFQSIVSCATLDVCMSEGEDFPQMLHLILESTANISVAWMGAAAGFQEGSSKNDVEKKLQDIQRHKENLCVFLDLGRFGLNRITSCSKQPQHLDHAMSMASAALVDFLSELLGHSTDSESMEKLLMTLSGIRSITPESCGMEMVTQSLLVLTKMIVCSFLEHSSCELLLKSILSQLRNVITCCHRTLQIVFHGTKLEKKILEMELHLLEPIHEADGCLPSVDVSNCPILYTMLTCLLALSYSSEIDPDQWQQIEVQLFQFLRERSEQRIAFLRTLIPLVCTAVQSELDNFRNTSLAEFVKINFGKNDHLWHLLISVFQY